MQIPIYFQLFTPKFNTICNVLLVSDSAKDMHFLTVGQKILSYTSDTKLHIL